MAGNLRAVNIGRGLAALSVLVYHYQLGATLAKYTGLTAFQALSMPGALYGVPLFFAISGYCIHRSNAATVRDGRNMDWQRYARKRLRRLYPAYLFALVLSLSIMAWEGKPLDTTDVAVHLMVLQGFSPTHFNSINLVLWTITIELCFYAAYPAWLAVRLRSGMFAALGLSLATSLVSIAVLSLFPSSLPLEWFFLNSWFGWTLGAWLSEIEDPTKTFGPSWWSVGAIATAILVTLDLGAFAAVAMPLRLEVLIRVVVCVWLLSVLLANERRFDMWARGHFSVSAILATCGVVSYSIYLLHEPLIMLRNIVTDGIPNGSLRQAVQLLWLPLIVVSSIASYYYVERPFLASRASTGQARWKGSRLEGERDIAP